MTKQEAGSEIPILVTDLDVVELVGLRVTKLCTAGTPLRVDWALDELDLVKAVVDERLELLWSSEVAVERKTGVATDDCDVC